MSDNSVETKPVSRVSVIDEFELGDLLPGGVAFEIQVIERANPRTISEGEVSNIYTAITQSVRMAKVAMPKKFTYSSVREHYGL
ncbi:hypothetical protein KY333_01745 [Candidatus Woesearchaeota archaeon]|nr:hypothetical protein [Candidatus Woesearchaeota archaeon]MBW2994412.1 hypothetical protein [Candidatus Woesearchaeota archaeon]